MGKSSTFLIFSSNLDQFFLIFPQTLLIFFLILALRVGESPTREGPGYATGPISLVHVGILEILCKIAGNSEKNKQTNKQTKNKQTNIEAIFDSPMWECRTFLEYPISINLMVTSGNDSPAVALIMFI